MVDLGEADIFVGQIAKLGKGRIDGCPAVRDGCQ